MRPRRPAAVLLLLLLGPGACGGGEQERTPEGWRTIMLRGCCRLAVPPNMTTPREPGGADNPVRTFVRPGLAVSFEYAPQVSFPRMHTIQRGWAQETIAVEGRRADLVSYEAGEKGFEGGRSVHVRVPLADHATFLSAPAPQKGMELGVSILCRTEADCAEGRRIAGTADFQPFRGG